MTVWLTGSSGFIGKHLYRELISSGYNLSCISNNLNLKDECENPHTYYLNFSSENDIKNLINRNGCPDVFIHLGWGDIKDSTSSIHLSKNLDDAKTLIETLYLSAGARPENGQSFQRPPVLTIFPQLLVYFQLKQFLLI